MGVLHAAVQNGVCLCTIVRFAFACAFLCVVFFYGLQKSANLRRILQKCAKSASMQYPLQLYPLLRVTDLLD